MSEPAQYYIAKPGGEPLGPYTLSMLKVMAMERRLTPNHLYCTEGMTEWLPVGKLLESAKFPMPALRGARDADLPKTHLTPSIVMLVISAIACTFCLPFSIAAVVQAARANSSYDVVKRQTLANSARLWLNISYIVLVLQLVMFLALIIFA